MILPKTVIRQSRESDILRVTFSDGSHRFFNIYDLAVEWFCMSNDTFYACYGFNFNPHNFRGVYEEARKRVYGGLTNVNLTKHKTAVLRVNRKR